MRHVLRIIATIRQRKRDDPYSPSHSGILSPAIFMGVKTLTPYLVVASSTESSVIPVYSMDRLSSIIIFHIFKGFPSPSYLCIFYYSCKGRILRFFLSLFISFFSFSLIPSLFSFGIIASSRSGARHVIPRWWLEFELESWGRRIAQVSDPLSGSGGKGRR